MRKRLDTHLCELGLFKSREVAKAAIMEGLVSVEGKQAVKPGTQVTGAEKIVVANGGQDYVSRGGLKLEHALDVLGINVTGKVAIDVGASTGGFTDCLLKRGAAKVIAVDVGKGQLHWKLRRDPRVVVLENVNARYLEPGDLPVTPALATVDVSFISLTKVLKPAFGVLSADGEAVVLVKPQFEAGPGLVGKGGVVKDRRVHLDVLLALRDWLVEHRFCLSGIITSPLKGPKGNLEFFMHIRRGSTLSLNRMDIEREVDRAHVRIL